MNKVVEILVICFISYTVSTTYQHEEKGEKTQTVHLSQCCDLLKESLLFVKVLSASSVLNICRTLITLRTWYQNFEQWIPTMDKDAHVMFEIMCGHKIFFWTVSNCFIMIIIYAYNKWKENNYSLMTAFSLVQSCRGIIDCTVFFLVTNSEQCNYRLINNFNHIILLIRILNLTLLMIIYEINMMHVNWK